MIHNSEWQPGHLEFTLLGHCVWKGGSSLSKSVSNETVMNWNLWMWLKLILRIQSLVILRHHSALITRGDYSWDWTWGSENSECWSPKAAGHPLRWVWPAVAASPEVRMDMPSWWEERRPTIHQPLLLCGSFSLPHIFQDLGQDTHQLTLPGLLGSVHCDSDPVPGNPPTPSAAATGPKCWRMLWPFNLWWRRLELTPLEAELAIKAGVFTAKPACFPLYPEEKMEKQIQSARARFGFWLFFVTSVTVESHWTFLVCSVFSWKQR